MSTVTPPTAPKKTLALTFGAMSDPLIKQLRKQKFLFDEDTVDHFQKDIDAFNRLRIRGYLTTSETKNVNDKLFKKITQHLEMNK